MRSTMQERPLLIREILNHGRLVHASSEVVTCLGDGFRRTSFGEVARRAEQLAAALARLGVSRGDRVATFCFNHQEHLEAYLAVPAMGAVLHTLNVRLFADQLAFVIDHAEDKVIIADSLLAPALERVLKGRTSVEHVIAVGEEDVSALGDTLGYEELIAAEEPGFDWPDLEENAPAAMCYTSGTTGRPKGRRLQPPLHLPALSRLHVLGAARDLRLRQDPASSCPSSTSTPGACPMPPG